MHERALVLHFEAIEVNMLSQISRPITMPGIIFTLIVCMYIIDPHKTPIQLNCVVPVS